MSEASAVSETTRREAVRAGSGAWDWVDTTVWTERMLAALENGVTGGKWYSLMDKVYHRRVLEASWQRVRRNRGAAGVDRVSVERFAGQAEHYLEELSEALRTGTYRPQAVRRVEIPKGDGGVRPLGVPTVKDRVVQGALKAVLEPIFEREFRPSSYGFRPGRGCKDALRVVDGALREGFTWVVDADLARYFDSIPQAPLLARVAERVSDGRVLALVESYLGQEVLHGLERWTPTAGTPQGAVLSPLLANLYLHGLDEALEQAGHRLVRYADDFVVLCRTQAEAEAALARVRQWVQVNGLRLHPDKTHVGNCLEPGQGFEFLGYRFEGGRRYVRRKSLQALQDRIRQRTRRTRAVALERIVADLTPMLRGWFQYFQHAHRWTFPRIDGFVRRRLRALLRKREKRPGFGRCSNDHRRWPKAYFAGLGLFTLTEAHRLARQSR